jgi:hypothetical protein
VTLWSYPLQTNPALNSTFDIAGQYVWHCHIVEHEDNGMMVPCVGDKASAPGCSVVPWRSLIPGWSSGITRAGFGRPIFDKYCGFCENSSAAAAAPITENNT